MVQLKATSYYQLLSKEVTIKEPGYVYIYVSNEGSIAQEVYFDDFNVEHTKSPVIQVEDYYPFGLTFNGYQKESTTIDRYQFSGKENQDELGLEWLDYGARMYNKEIGRWMATDPLADSSISMTPFHFVANNPLIYVDPDGRDWFVNKNNGATIFIKGEKEFSYAHLEKILGKELTAKISEGMGADAWENFGGDKMFDTKNDKLSDKTMIVMDPKASESFMNSFGLQKVLDQQVDERYNQLLTMSPSGEQYSIENTQKEILSSKVTYKRREEIKKYDWESDEYSAFHGTFRHSRYRQIIYYHQRVELGVSFDSNKPDWVKIGEGFLPILERGKKRK